MKLKKMIIRVRKKRGKGGGEGETHQEIQKEYKDTFRKREEIILHVERWNEERKKTEEKESIPSNYQGYANVFGKREWK